MHRRLFVTSLALALFCVVGTHSAYAKRYCLQGQHWGYPGDCSFSSYSQCAAAASGTHSHCGINPRYAHQNRRQSH
jgi:hypothetical protein